MLKLENSASKLVLDHFARDSVRHIRLDSFDQSKQSFLSKVGNEKAQIKEQPKREVSPPVQKLTEQKSLPHSIKPIKLKDDAEAVKIEKFNSELSASPREKLKVHKLP